MLKRLSIKDFCMTRQKTNPVKGAAAAKKDEKAVKSKKEEAAE